MKSSAAPWKFFRFQDGILVKDVNNEKVCSLDYSHREGMNEKTQANAALIVAAPNMLEVLESVRSALEHEGDPDVREISNETYRLVMDAIEKARGES